MLDITAEFILIFVVYFLGWTLNNNILWICFCSCFLLPCCSLFCSHEQPWCNYSSQCRSTESCLLPIAERRVFFSGSEKISKSSLISSLHWCEPVDSGFSAVFNVFFFFHYSSPTQNTGYNCESQSILLGSISEFRKTLFANDWSYGWIHSNLRLLSMANAVPLLGFFFSFLLFALFNTAWEHSLTLYPWPDSLAKNSSGRATWVQSRWKHAAAGKQGGQTAHAHKTKHIKGAQRILEAYLHLGLQNKGV